jgi:hypothetical protein
VVPFECTLDNLRAEAENAVDARTGHSNLRGRGS